MNSRIGQNQKDDFGEFPSEPFDTNDDIILTAFQRPKPEVLSEHDHENPSSDHETRTNVIIDDFPDQQRLWG